MGESSSGDRGRYAFGDGDLAALQLATVAEVFGPTSRAFLDDCAQTDLDLALDLGCGPGHTTCLISEALRPRRVVGLDLASSFLQLARRAAVDGVSFVEHDVTEVPFPTGAADLIYCRFLLTHLAHPGAQLAKWATQLRPGGMLLIDEVEAIHTKNPVFAAYLEVVAAMLHHRGNELYVGPLLDAMPAVPGLRRRRSRVATLSPPARQAAGMFLMNLRAWRNGSFIKSTYRDEVIDGLESDLAALGGSEGSPGITWGLRQISYQRA